jgi:uncharacterized protein (TIGR00290 family)
VKPVILSWSGGKDSALALTRLQQAGIRVVGLLTTVTSEYDRVSIHGVRRSLLRQQADNLQLDVQEIVIEPSSSNQAYETAWRETLHQLPPRMAEARHIAAGDIFLEDVRRYREVLLAREGKRGLFPLWGRDTTRLAHEFVAAGFRAVLVCVDPKQLDGSFAGREYDERLLAELPADVDPCGERGEFHTFVYAGPGFSEPIACRVGDLVQRDGFVFCDLEAG